LLERPLTPFRLFALYSACCLCPMCGLRSYARPFAWRVGKTPADDRVLLETPASRGVVHACRMHADSRHEYAVPDLLAESAVPGSARRRWKYWPRWNEERGVFEELVTEENRWGVTFLDFTYTERRAMQCIALFCDIREDWHAVFCCWLALSCLFDW
jgi:hypothetical protein